MDNLCGSSATIWDESKLNSGVFHQIIFNFSLFTHNSDMLSCEVIAFSQTTRVLLTGLMFYYQVKFFV